GAAGCGLSIASVGDYVALMKPRVMSLVVLTALVGVVVAPGHVHPVIGFTALLCIAVGAGAAGALNMWYDADIDAGMRRTSDRPIPQGRIAPREALAFGLVLAAFPVGGLGLLVSWLPAALLSFPNLLFRRCLSGMAKAIEAAEYCYRRRRGRLSSYHRLGGGDRRHLGRAVPPLPHHLLLDAATFLGAVARSRRRLRPRSRSDAPRGSRGGGNAATDSALFHPARAARCGPVASRLCPRNLWGDSARRRRADGRVRLAGAQGA